MKRPDPTLTPVVTKARGYLRVSTMLLSAVLVLCVAVLLVLQHQADVKRTNFDANSNLHVISVTHRLQGPALQTLVPADVEDVRSVVVGADGLPGTTTVSPRWALGAGLVAGADEPVALIGIDPEAGGLIGIDGMKDGFGYSTNPSSGPLLVAIPVVAAEGSDGMVSDELVEMELKPGHTIDPLKVKYLEGGRIDSLTYVTSDTYWRVAETMFDRDRTAIESAYQSGELPMVPLVEAVYVDVPELNDVRRVAGLLEERGYAVSYALQAFDEIESGLATQRLLGLALGLALIVGVGLHFVLSWRSYMSLSRRDIGTLKHWQISEHEIRRLYSGRLARSLVTPFLVATAAAWLGSLLLFGATAGTVRALLSMAVLLVVLCLLGVFVTLFVIRPWTRRDVLTLLRANREFQ
ncbi:hypothetical protein EQW78_10195 [Oerskovia turbata]|uniref:FtsX-like permease family protein n=1 Tax=Oerskovia turbata TaxID=1713 RepID=A0A4Q1KUT4_9CELL|nr:hypothetical protein [Oerskovia turbata]RXR25386.1 hypothetical protein EQW73_11120 [Oerskovia turbata]RXR33973.1 hypothetical protein EQW78_10195 [Oerskovia turbata]TGJ95653.1 hypothetical protein DLJ96_14130 [Actinotalea fermentans ATCC 43279 = JCM 9966 = DSM 3133]